MYSLFVQQLSLLLLINKVFLFETILRYGLLVKLTLNGLFTNY